MSLDNYLNFILIFKEIYPNFIPEYKEIGRYIQISGNISKFSIKRDLRKILVLDYIL